MTQNSTSAMTAMPTDLPSLISTLLSLSALREWLKLLLFGAVIEFSRRCLSSLWSWVLQSFWITVSFDDEDLSYSWVLFWLSQQPSWAKARCVEVTTRSYGLNSPGMSISGYEDDERDTSRPMTYIPSLSTTYSMWYKGRYYMTVSRTQTQSMYYRTSESLQISIFARDNSVLSQLLMDAKSAYKVAEENLISVFVSDTSSNWRHITSRVKRPLTSIILDPGIKELLLNDARDFLDSRNWYRERGIPFRRGYLLYGAPGTGKTSMIQSLAGELGLDVYIVTLSRGGMDDNSLSELISDLPKRCIALMEDIDAAFHRGISRSSLNDAEKKPGDKDKHDADREKPDESMCRVTLSGLLNALDGIGAQEGRILFATTNDYAALDPALCRPGRMDLHVEFKLASRYQAEALFRRFYTPSRLEEDAKEDINGEKASDSGFASRTPSPERVPLLSKSPDADSLPSSPTVTDFGETEKSVTKRSRPRGTLLSHSKADELARQFASVIPEREFSMAALQGYLMMYKVRPYEAVRDAASWVDRERMERKARQKGRNIQDVPS